MKAVTRLSKNPSDRTDKDRRQLLTAGVAMLCATPTAAAALSETSTLAGLWVERQAAFAEAKRLWSKFLEVRAACEDHYPVGGDLPGVWFPDGTGGVTRQTHHRELFDIAYRYECRNFPPGRKVADAMDAALERAKSWHAELQRQSSERETQRHDYEATQGGTAAYDAASALIDSVVDLDDRIARTPAASLTDLAVKARLAGDWLANWNEHEDGLTLNRLASEAAPELLSSIAADAERLASA